MYTRNDEDSKFHIIVDVMVRVDGRRCEKKCVKNVCTLNNFNNGCINKGSERGFGEMISSIFIMPNLK
jgi:hypothetical protein